MQSLHTFLWKLINKGLTNDYAITRLNALFNALKIWKYYNAVKDEMQQHEATK